VCDEVEVAHRSLPRALPVMFHTSLRHLKHSKSLREIVYRMSAMNTTYYHGNLNTPSCAARKLVRTELCTLHTRWFVSSNGVVLHLYDGRVQGSH
jgi:hypothetical protein